MNWDTLLLGDIGPEILEIAIDVFGNKWIGTSNSLSRYDTDSPSLLTVTPGNNKKNVSRTSKIVLNFSEPMNRSSVLSAFSISPSVSFSSSWDIHSTKLTLTPKSNLKSNKKYSVTLSKAATDIQGHPLADSASWSFTTVKSTSTPSTSFPSTLGGFSFPSSFSLFGNLSNLNLSGLLSNQFRTSLSFGGFGQTSMLKFPTSNLFGTRFGSTFSALSTLKLNLPGMTNFSNLTNIYGRFGTGSFSRLAIPGQLGGVQSFYQGFKNLQLQTSLPNLNLP
jgi:hypothetical protein